MGAYSLKWQQRDLRGVRKQNNAGRGSSMGINRYYFLSWSPILLGAQFNFPLFMV